MDNKLVCKICGKVVTKNNSYIGSHVKRVHNMKLEDYVINYYNDISPEFKKEQCGFCKNDAIYKIDINHDDLTFKRYYDGYICEDMICKNNISIDIFGHCYIKKKYEHIGSNVIYLSKKHKITIEEAKKLKYNENHIVEEKSKNDINGYILRYGENLGTTKYNERCDKIGKTNKKEWYINKYGIENGTLKWGKYLEKINCSLIGYINRYGENLGTTKYKERCIKIGKTNNIDWYIDKHGDEKGNILWNNYMTKLKKINQQKISKSSLKIKKILDSYDIDYNMEYKINSVGKICDYYIENFNTIIEFYGDYWHCNPNKFNSDFYHTYIKKTAQEVWEYDNKRINEIYNSFNKKVNIIIIWEETSKSLSNEFLLKLIIDNKQKNMIIKI